MSRPAAPTPLVPTVRLVTSGERHARFPSPTFILGTCTPRGEARPKVTAKWTRKIASRRANVSHGWVTSNRGLSTSLALDREKILYVLSDPRKGLVYPLFVSVIDYNFPALDI